MYNYLDFEKPVQDLELKILELKKLAENGEAVDVADEIGRLEKRSRDALRDLYKALTPWQKVQV
ncbi:MAG: acetyl-CoA carboxylase carboxyl transferase subunit alpha, partial [Mesorhizobium sp.]